MVFIYYLENLFLPEKRVKRKEYKDKKTFVFQIVFLYSAHAYNGIFLRRSKF
jgi:hypothetical protein